MPASSQRQLSVVVPVFNGATTIARLVAEVRETLAAYDPEIVLVNDGSRDASEAVCEAIARSTPGVKFISLRRNFGEHNAVLCGLNHTEGEFVAVIDDDFQNPPTEIAKLVEEARKGYDVVYSRYLHKCHSPWRNFGSWLHNRLADWLIDKPRGLYLSSFKVIRGEVVREVVKYKGPFAYIDGLIFRVTDSATSVVVDHCPRAEGRSNYTLRRLVRLTINMFLNFSMRPLRLCAFVGVLLSLLAVVLSVVVVIEKLMAPAEPAGWASIMVAILGLSGVQFIFFGLIGEYLGKTYLDLNGTPQWVVKKRVFHDGRPGDDKA